MIVFLNSEWYFFQSLAVQGLNKWWMGGSEQKFLMKQFFCVSNSCHDKACRVCFLTFSLWCDDKILFWFTGKTRPESKRWMAHAASLVFQERKNDIECFHFSYTKEEGHWLILEVEGFWAPPGGHETPTEIKWPQLTLIKPNGCEDVQGWVLLAWQYLMETQSYTAMLALFSLPSCLPHSIICSD